MDSLDVNDACKRPVVYKKFISGLSSQFVSRPQNYIPRPIVWETQLWKTRYNSGLYVIRRFLCL